MSENVTITLSELHCETQSEAGGCEPYLFTSFFAIGADGDVKVTSPKHSDVRGAFADDIDAGMRAATSPSTKPTMPSTPKSRSSCVPRAARSMPTPCAKRC
jgi:hypothetical protein